jgi:hypothetical protein
MNREEIINELVKIDTGMRYFYETRTDEYLKICLEQNNIDKELFDTQEDIKELELKLESIRKELELQKEKFIELKYSKGITIGQRKMIKNEGALESFIEKIKQ